jgi:DUF2075 family protein
MYTEKITVRVTETKQTLEVVVFSKRVDMIEVVIGEGINNVKASLTPTRNGLAYAGSVMGREIVYERSRDQVQADIDRLNPNMRKPGRR